MPMLRTPRWARASITAFTKAAGEPTVAYSPMPLAPIGWCGDGVTVCSCSTSRHTASEGSTQDCTRRRPDQYEREGSL